MSNDHTKSFLQLSCTWGVCHWNTSEMHPAHFIWHKWDTLSQLKWFTELLMELLWECCKIVVCRLRIFRCRHSVVFARVYFMNFPTVIIPNVVSLWQCEYQWWPRANQLLTSSWQFSWPSGWCRRRWSWPSAGWRPGRPALSPRWSCLPQTSPEADPDTRSASFSWWCPHCSPWKYQVYFQLFETKQSSFPFSLS